MNHKRHEQLTENKKDIKIKPPTPSNPESILENPVCKPKLLVDEVLLKEDIIAAANILFRKYDLDFDAHFLLIDHFKKIDSGIRFKNRPFFCIYDREDKHWSLFCMLQNANNKTVILHKDSTGMKILSQLENSIKAKLPDTVCLNHSKKEEVDKKLLGPICLRNLDIMLELLNKEDGGKNKLIETFLQMKFCDMKEINLVKMSTVTKLTNELKQNASFLKEFKIFLNKLPTEMGKKAIAYRKLLEDELKKDEKEFDVVRVNEARSQFTQKEAEKICKDYNIDDKAKKDGFKLEIEAKFPNEMKRLLNIFTALEHVAKNDNFFTGLRTIGEILEVDPEKLKVLYEKESNNIKTEEKLKIKGIDDIKKSIKKPKTTPSNQGNTPFAQLLHEVVLGMDGIKTIQNKDKTDLQVQFDFVQEQFASFNTWDLQKINKWAKDNKNKSFDDKKKLCELIAIMNRAFNELTSFNLRDTQILAVLVFFFKADKGRLLQIKTGEGKTVIVSLVATIKALQGQVVDVITSNEILAKEGVKETKNFYNVFNLTVAANNVTVKLEKEDQEGNPYDADILYGSISNFQFDYLKDSFEGMFIRNDRRFGYVILDEVDSMLVDNGGHIAKLSSKFPGMECLRYIYIHIWRELLHAEEVYKKETDNKVKKKVEELKNSPEKVREVLLSNYIEELAKNERKFLKDQIEASKPLNTGLIPPHLQEYCDSKLKVWIKNAIHVRYNCHENQQYRLILPLNSDEKIVVPVDNRNTGITLMNTIWSYGVHQFIQLKHNLCLTFESLTGSFISNIGYIKNYPTKNIYGLTGTLGSTSEQKLLQNIYGVDFAKLPTYKPKQFKELPGLIIDDDDWANEVALNILQQIYAKRSVLVICETEADLLLINSNLEVLNTIQYKKINIRIFGNEDEADQTSKKVQVGHVIISTNISGRGTNFKTTKELEANGGLHVCVGFLPCNKRVEDQAFGRTSRQGNKGTAQLIVRQSEIDQLNLPRTSTFTIIKKERDYLEKQRLNDIDKVLVPELNFKDEIFKRFSELYKTFKFEKGQLDHFYVVQDLKEFWAFWLESKNYSAKNLPVSVDAEFNDFKMKALRIHNKEEIIHNPNYSVLQAEYYLQQEQYDKAIKSAENAIDLGSQKISTTKIDFVPGAHLKLFEILMKNNTVLMKRFKEAMASILWIPYKGKDSKYPECKKHLTKALETIQKEITYIDQNVTIVDNNKKFKEIIVQENLDKNIFIKHIAGRQALLQVYQGNISDLLKEFITNENAEFILNGKVPVEKKLLKEGVEGNDVDFTDNEFSELKSVSVESVYYLRVVQKVPETLIKVSKGLILSGIGLLAIGLVFPPSFVFLAPAAGALISEGILDIVTAIISSGDTKFDKGEYLSEKFKSIGISLLTIGISAVSLSIKILTKAVNFCQKVSKVLRSSGKFKELCKTAAKFVDGVQHRCKKMLKTAIEVKKVRTVASRKQLFLNFSKEYSVSIGKKVGKAVLSKYALEPLYEATYQKLFDHIRKRVKKNLKETLRANVIVCNKLNTCAKNKINNRVESFIETNDHIAKKVSYKLLGHLKKEKINVWANMTTLAEKFKDLIVIGTQLSNFLEKYIPDGGTENNDLDTTIDEIAETVSTKFTELIKGAVNINVKYKIKNYSKVNGKKKNKDAVGIGARAGEEEDDNTKLTQSYELLGVDADAPEIEITMAYCRLALCCHPDKFIDDEDAAKVFEEIQDAYENIRLSVN